MTIIPAAVLTTTQLVGGLVASAKNAHELAKASRDYALKDAISELYDSLLDVKARVLELDQENRELKAAIAKKDEFIGPIEPFGYFFYKDKSDLPLCPRCFQSIPSNPVFLSSLKDSSVGQYRTCLVCRYEPYETRYQTNARSMRLKMNR